MISVKRLRGYDYDLVMRVGCRPEHELMLFQCITSSAMTWVGYVEDAPACMWGLIPPTLLSDRAYLWLLVTELVREHQFCFVRHSQLEMAKMLEKYPTIVGHCDRSHKDSMRWLRWLGAKFDETPGQYASFMITGKEQ